MNENQVETPFLIFNQVVPERLRKTEIWEVYGKRNRALLGVIQWYGKWRQYVFYPAPDTLFNSTCLGDIQWFCSIRNGVHARQLKEEKAHG